MAVPRVVAPDLPSARWCHRSTPGGRMSVSWTGTKPSRKLEEAGSIPASMQTFRVQGTKTCVVLISMMGKAEVRPGMTFLETHLSRPRLMRSDWTRLMLSPGQLSLPCARNDACSWQQRWAHGSYSQLPAALNNRSRRSARPPPLPLQVSRTPRPRPGRCISISVL